MDILGALTATGDAVGDTFFSIENLRGSDFADSLRGSNIDNLIQGGDGDDQLFGIRGNDTLEGDAGADTLFGEDGADVLNGGAGDDRLVGGAEGDLLIGGAGADRLVGGDGFDIASYETATVRVRVDLSGGLSETGDAAGDLFSSIERIVGTDFADILIGDGAANDFAGGADDDRLVGNGGADTLTGGTGADRLIGGSEADVFVFDDGDSGVGAAARDLIVDFDQSDGDLIDLSAIDAAVLFGGDQAFVFIGNAAFTGAGGEVRFEAVGGDTVIQADTTGFLITSFEIELRGAVTLVEGDFIL